AKLMAQAREATECGCLFCFWGSLPKISHLGDCSDHERMCGRGVPRSTPNLKELRDVTPEWPRGRSCLLQLPNTKYQLPFSDCQRSIFPLRPGAGRFCWHLRATASSSCPKSIYVSMLLKANQLRIGTIAAHGF